MKDEWLLFLLAFLASDPNSGFSEMRQRRAGANTDGFTFISAGGRIAGFTFISAGGRM